MPRSPSYASVSDWLDAEYRVETAPAPQLSAQTLGHAGQVVRSVHPESPAGRLGVRAGDILYNINGTLFTQDGLERSFRPRFLGRPYVFELLRPDTAERLRITGRTFPFGLMLGHTVSGFTAALRNGNPDPHDVDQFFADGDTQALAALWPALEAFNARLRLMDGRPFEGSLPTVVAPDVPLTDDEALIWFGNHTWLALAAAHAGQWARARFVLDAVEAFFERSGESGMMSMFAAQAATRALLAGQAGEQETAVAHLHHAIDMSPDTQGLYSQLSALTGSRVDPPTSAFLGVKPRITLPRRDPARRLAQPAGEVSLAERAGALRPGQFMLLITLSRYRSNGPYVWGLDRAMTPLLRLRDVFSDVLVVTSWDPVENRKIHFPTPESDMRKQGIDISVLFDAQDALSDQLSLTSAPTNLVIDHRGIVVAEGWLAGDAVLWDALASGRA